VVIFRVTRFVGVVEGNAAVPGRTINSKFDAAGFAGVGQLADDIAFTVLPPAALDAVVGGGGGPEAKAIVMFCGEDDAFESRFLCDAHPLIAIERGGVEEVGILRTEPGAAAGESVHAEMREQREFVFLPGELRGRGERTNGFRRFSGIQAGRHGGNEGENQRVGDNRFSHNSADVDGTIGLGVSSIAACSMHF